MLYLSHGKNVHIQKQPVYCYFFPKFDHRQFANVVIGDKSLVNFFEPVRKIGNKIQLTKHGRRPVVAKRRINEHKEGPP